MIELLTTNYKGRTGIIKETRQQWYKIEWVREANGQPLGHTSWKQKTDVRVII